METEPGVVLAYLGGWRAMGGWTQPKHLGRVTTPTADHGSAKPVAVVPRHRSLRSHAVTPAQTGQTTRLHTQVSSSTFTHARLPTSSSLMKWLTRLQVSMRPTMSVVDTPSVRFTWG